MTLSPIKRYREKKAYERYLAIEAADLRFHRYCMEVMSNMSKNGHNFNA